MFKTKTYGLNTSISIQLKIDPTLRSIITRLEVRVPMPAGIQISGISTAPNTIIGAVSIQKDDTQLLWNLSSLLPNNKLKEEVTMNVGIETIRPVSLTNVQSVVRAAILLTLSIIQSIYIIFFVYFKISFAATGSTLSGARISLAQQSDLKLISSKSIQLHLTSMLSKILTQKGVLSNNLRAVEHLPSFLSFHRKLLMMM